MCAKSCGSDGKTSCGSNGGFESQGLLNFFSSQTPARKNQHGVREQSEDCAEGGQTNSEGGRNPFPQTPRLPSALSWRRAERDAISNPDFQRKKFEHYPKSSTISRKSQNRQKTEKEKYQVEGGAEFPPETPLPPRPHFCWPFWEFRGQMQKVRGAKKRGRGRVEKKEKNIIFVKIKLYEVIRSGPLPL